MVADLKTNIRYLSKAYSNLDCAHWADGPFCPHYGERAAIRILHAQTTRRAFIVD